MDPDTHQIMSQVYRAKKDNSAADEMIADYMPFIKAETAKFLNRSPDQSDDELSIAMFGFYEAIRSYSRLRGSFLKFASLKIRNRLIDFYRREKRHRIQVSLDEQTEDKADLLETLVDDHDDYAESEMREATKQEILELSAHMKDFGVSMSDIAENSPKQQRTLVACQKAVVYARYTPEILEEFLRSKRVPLAKLARGAGVERKTLERHRRYLVAVLLICTNGYEILRGHIMQVLKGGDKK